MKPMCEPMEEQMEIVLTSRQIFVLAILIVGVALVMFVVGFSMGKRVERRRLVIGNPQATADLLTRLDEMEKESREFVAKKALTEVRKQEVSVEELPPAPTSDMQNATNTNTNTLPSDRMAPQTSFNQQKPGVLALTRVKSVAKTTSTSRTLSKRQATSISAVSPSSQRQVSGSFGRKRRVEPAAAHHHEPQKVSAHR